MAPGLLRKVSAALAHKTLTQRRLKLCSFGCSYRGALCFHLPRSPQRIQEEGRVWMGACPGARRFTAVGLMGCVGVRPVTRRPVTINSICRSGTCGLTNDSDHTSPGFAARHWASTVRAQDTPAPLEFVPGKFSQLWGSGGSFWLLQCLFGFFFIKVSLIHNLISCWSQIYNRVAQQLPILLNPHPL